VPVWQLFDFQWQLFDFQLLAHLGRKAAFATKAFVAESELFISWIFSDSQRSVKNDAR
jgi:hypothetical protein